jgi:hypothetical protein
MSNYGRNFEFRIPPVHGSRGGRFVLPADADPIVIGAPVVVAAGATPDAAFSGALPVELATGATNKPTPGMGGIVLYEHAPAAYAGYDPALTTYSDIDMVPAGKQCQVIQDGAVKIVLRNTEDRVFLNSRNYTGRTMVAGLGATPTLAVGDMLTPGVGDDTDGYWAETANADEAWLIITNVDAARAEVECRLNF